MCWSQQGHSVSESEGRDLSYVVFGGERKSRVFHCELVLPECSRPQRVLRYLREGVSPPGFPHHGQDTEEEQPG